MSHFYEIFWICKHCFSSWRWKLKFIRSWKIPKMNIQSFNHAINLAQIVCYWFIFLKSWILLNWPLSKLLACWRWKNFFHVHFHELQASKLVLTRASASIWMDYALMGVPFLSVPILLLSQVVSIGWLLFSPFLNNLASVFVLELVFYFSTLALVSHIYLHLNYLPMHQKGLLSRPPSYLPTCPTTYLSVHLAN